MRFRALLVLPLVVVLAGCGAPTPVPTTPAATEGPVAIEAPTRRLPLGCDDLVSSSTVASFVGHPTTSSDETARSITTWWDVVRRTAGSLICTWGAEPGLADLYVSVVTDTAGNADISGDLGYSSTYYERFDEFGDASVRSCSYGQCWFRILVGTQLITGYANRADLMDELDLLPALTPVLSELTDAVAAALPNLAPAWSAPDGVLAGWGPFCEPGAPIDELGALFGMTAPFSTGYDYDPATVVMFDDVGMSWCILADEADPSGLYVTVVVVEGADWVAGEWDARPPEAWGGVEPESFTLDGGGRGYVVSSDAGSAAMVAVDGSFISVDANIADRDRVRGWAADVYDLLASRA